MAIAACFFVGFAVKMGLVPLQSWLPLAHPEAPSSISGPLSGILTKAGLFGMVKVLYATFGAAALTRFAFEGADVTTVLMVLGCLTLIYGEIRALLEPELKRMLAFSTLAQIGEITAILAIGTALANDASLLHLTNHAVMKTLLFYAAGALIVRAGGRRIENLAGLGRVMPLTAGMYALASFAIMGLPPFSGFVSKFLMIYAAAANGYVAVAALLLLGGIIGVIYYTRVVSFLFYYPYKGEAGVREAPATMLAAMGVLAAAIIFGGFAPGFQLSLIGAVGDLSAVHAALQNLPLPGLVADWPLGASIAMAGAVAVLLVGRASVAWAGRLAVLGSDRGSWRRDLRSRTLRPSLLLLRSADRRRGRAQHAALHRLSRAQPCPGALLRGLHRDDRGPPRHDAGQGHLQLLRLLGTDEFLGAVGRHQP